MSAAQESRVILVPSRLLFGLSSAQHGKCRCASGSFCSTDSFITVTASFPSSGSSGGSPMQRKLEIVASLADVRHETGGTTTPRVGTDGPSGQSSWSCAHKSECFSGARPQHIWLGPEEEVVMESFIDRSAERCPAGYGVTLRIIISGKECGSMLSIQRKRQTE